MERMGEKVKGLREAAGIPSHPALAKLVSRRFGKTVHGQSIQQLEAGGIESPRYKTALAKVFGLTVEQLEGEPLDRLIEIMRSMPDAAVGKLESATLSRYRLAEPEEQSIVTYIRRVDLRGSCGSGAVAFDTEDRMPLIKEPSWFKKYGRPEDMLAVWADGDSMANFIVDGDIAIFDTSKRSPKSGQIFLIQHPDGLRIKRLRREIDGSWVLESDNPDKRSFPDERVTPDQADLLKILGEFVYRQGG